jgi:hypothetical protein
MYPPLTRTSSGKTFSAFHVFLSVFRGTIPAFGIAIAKARMPPYLTIFGNRSG